MLERGAHRGLPIPTLWQLVAVGAALTASWLAWSRYDRRHGNVDDAFATDPFENLRTLERNLRAEAVPMTTLMEALNSPDSRKRGLAAYGLGTMGSAAGPALVNLRDRLGDENAQVRGNAAVALVQISHDMGTAAAAIAPLLADPDDAVRDSVGRALLEIGATAVNPLVQALDSDQAIARLEALRVLRKMYSFNQQHSHNAWNGMRSDAIDKVGGLVNNPDARVRLEALTAAAEWGVAGVKEQLRELLHKPERVDIALAAIRNLARQ